MNVNKKINKNIENILKYIRTWKIDILFLQETNNISKKTKIKLDNTFDGTYLIHTNENHTNEAGVMTLIKNMPNTEITDKTNIPSNGRILKITLKIMDTNLHLFNVYVPLTRAEREPLLLKVIQHISPGLICIGGDFNFVEDKDLDISRGPNRVQQYKSVGSNAFDIIKASTNITDAWRNLFPNKREFSRVDVRGTRTRLDRIYLSQDQIGQTISSSYNIIPFSDHYLHQLKLSTKSFYPNDLIKGPGTWKLNNSLLSKSNTAEIITNLWNTWTENKVNYNNPLEWWDEGKKRIKEMMIKIGKKEKSKTTAEEKQLIDELKRKTEDFKGQPDIWLEMQQIKQNLNRINNEKMESVKIRSREKIYENWEKNTSYFYTKLKTNQQKQTFTSILNQQGEIKYGNEMLEEISKFYKELYQSECDENKIIKYIQETHSIPKLSENNKELCEGYITEQEAYKALKAMNNNKTPGEDGLTKEFYMYFWDLIGKDLIENLNNCLLKGQMSDSMKTAIISLLYKKGDRKDIRNWRPISLLNIDYKILTKVLATRIKKVLPSIIDMNQTCGVKGRNISDHLLLIYYLEKYINNPDQIRPGGYIMCLDQEKAFDHMEHSFIFHALKAFNFGPIFLDWIICLYKNINSKVNINGIVSDQIPIQRGVRQGCPLSMILFTVSIELLLIRIRQNNKIKGTKLTDGTILKIMAYADDVNLWINNSTEIQEIFNIYKSYGTASGAKLNKQKTEILKLGKYGHNKLSAEWEVYIKNGVKILGIYYSNDKMMDTNYGKKLDKIKEEIRYLKNRNLTLYGKANVINTLLISKLQYIIKIIPIHKNYITKIERELYTYLWGTYHLELLGRKTAQLPFDQGGLKITSLELLNKAAIISHFTDYEKPGYAPWKSLYAYFYGISLRGKITIDYSATHSPYLRDEYKGNIKEIHTIWDELEKLDKTKVKLGNIMEILRRDVKHIPTIRCKYPLLDWNQIFKQNTKNKILPFYILEINYRILHNILYTKMFYINKFNQQHITDRKCRLCKNGEEDIEHLLTKCRIFTELKQYVKNLLQNKNSINLQIWIKKEASCVQDHIFLSYYRIIVYNTWTKQETPQPYQLIYQYNHELEKFKHILEKFHPDTELDSLSTQISPQ